MPRSLNIAFDYLIIPYDFGLKSAFSCFADIMSRIIILLSYIIPEKLRKLTIVVFSFYDLGILLIIFFNLEINLIIILYE